MKVYMILAVIFAVAVYAKADEEDDIKEIEEWFDSHKDKIEACEKEEGITGKECHEKWKSGTAAKDLPEGCSCLVCCMATKLVLNKDGSDPKECQIDAEKVDKYICDMSEESDSDKKKKEIAKKLFEKCRGSTQDQTGCDAGKAIATCLEMAYRDYKDKQKKGQ